MSLDTELIDLIADALETADLPDHTLVKYRRPKAILPEMCPMLVVWVRYKEPRPGTTQWYDAVVTVGVSWHEEAIEEAETLTPDEILSTSLLDNLDIIQTAIRDLCNIGNSITEAWQMLPSTVTYMEPRRETGLTEGYTCDVVINVTEE